MKIMAATGPEKILVEMTKSEFERLAKFSPDGEKSYNSVNLHHLKVGAEIDVCKTIKNAEAMLEDLRFVGPELQKASERLARLSQETIRFNRMEDQS